MPVVTVPSSNAGTPAVSFTFNAANASGLSVAQQISNALQGAATPFPSGPSTLTVTTVSASGAAPSVSGGSTQELYISSVASAANVTAPTGYGYIVNNAQTATTITAAANTLILTGAFGGTFVESGNATIVAAAGNNVISQSGAGSVYLLGGDGNDILAASGSGTLGGGLGSNTATLSGSGQLYRASATASDRVFFGAGASNDTISAEAGSNLTVFGSSGQVRFTNSGQAANFTGGADDKAIATVGASSDNLTITADSTTGSIFFTNNKTGATVNAGAAGAPGATVYGTAGTNVAVTGGAGTTNNPVFVVAGSGNETLNASASTGTVWLSINTSVSGANAGAVAMIGGSGNDYLVVGGAPGAAILTGNAGADSFVFFRQAAGFGANTITDFGNGADALFIEGYGYGANNAGAGALGSSGQAVSGGVQLTLTGGATILFTNFSSAGALQTALIGKLHTS